MDVYSAKDFRKHDNEIKHLYEILHQSFLPDALLVLVKTVIELDGLTTTLDEALWEVLEEELGVEDTITPQLYARAYRICDNYDERAYQIELIVEVGHMVETTTKIPMIATLLKVARRPVTGAGWGDLREWIDRGLGSFQRMHGAHEFLGAIQGGKWRSWMASLKAMRRSPHYSLFWSDHLNCRAVPVVR